MGFERLVARMLVASVEQRAGWTATDWNAVARLVALVSLPASLVWVAEEASVIGDAGMLMALPCALLSVRLAAGWRSNRRWRAAWRLP